MKFQKNPIVIEAERYNVGVVPLPKGVCNSQLFLCPLKAPHVHTMHDNQSVILKDGDWIIPEPDGVHFYPCDAEVFEKTYTPYNGVNMVTADVADKAYLETLLGLQPGIAAFMLERLRQQSAEGYDAAHDDGHKNGEMAKSALCYTWVAAMLMNRVPFDEASERARNDFPWDISCWWKPSKDIKRNIEKAGALLAAEYDRLCRAEQQPPTAPVPVEPDAPPPASTRQFSQSTKHYPPEVPVEQL